ncbi:HAD family hydrolase [Ferrimonas balearica]|uniref:HAD family hydrolase n=1 Tax=Ferrimonas balearica TaxID=44012 RepID=UPI001C59BB5D|nr:HAD family hydrolase [Ferrimonas balearica]MBW3138657.1 HAD family hydrolase [Ferrimonas balearica]MBW3163744.1 HAD family hydrolase [Ferrimonas balearica]MBY5979450.1 HAD family hydrolase [Ferrimonas balearica]MBY6105718.1 HAD family hydrolase [Ferrimonas balearica]MBY6223741.1 HAD family hydrolase [Ferrimonas balearica]
MKEAVKLIAFDADDTLWVNEPYYRGAEQAYVEILGRYVDHEDLATRLYQTEVKNLNLFGYGAKGYMLSMIETALELTQYQIDGRDIDRIIQLGKEVLSYPIEILPQVRETLETLQGRYPLMVITKGDLLDQESKVARSGLADYFGRIDVVSEKDPATYGRLFSQLGRHPQEVLMVGNSLKSDILPVLEIGGHACHVDPGYEGWVHEQVTEQCLAEHRFHSFDNISKVLTLL